MLSTTSSTRPHATVCARCFVRLLVPRCPVAAFTRPLSSRHGPHDGQSTTDDSVHSGRRERRDDQHAERRLRPEHQSEVLHGRWDPDVREQSARLQSTSLGKPLTVVLLKDAKREQRAASKTETNSPRPPGAKDPNPELVQSLTASLDAEKSPVPFEMIKNALDGLRPKPQQAQQQVTLSPEELGRLAQQLRAGFTFAQLRQYLDHSKQERHAGLELDPSAAVGDDSESLDGSDSRMRIGNWRPGVSSIGPSQGLPARRDSTALALAGKGSKDVLVGRVLRDCWHILVRHDVKTVGQVDVRLSRRDLDTLLVDESNPLKEASARHQARLEVSRLRCVIRITAPQTQARAVLARIKRALAGVQRMVVDLVPVRAAIANRRDCAYLTAPEFIQAMGRLTGMGCRMLDAMDTMELSRPSTSVAPLESVRRLFLALVKSPSNEHYETRSSWDVQSASGGMALYAVHNHSRMSWIERWRGWARLHLARPKHDLEEGPRQWTTTEHSSTADPAESARQLILQTLFQQRFGSPKPDPAYRPLPATTAPSGSVADGPDEHLPATPWATRMREVTVATVGYVLREEGAAAYHPVPAVLRDELSQKAWRRTFLSDVPGLARSVASRFTRSMGRKHETLSIRLKPSPWASSYGGKTSAAFPAIELLLDVDPRARRTRLARVQAIVERRVCNVLVPQKVADLRFTSRLSLELEHPERSPVVTDYLGRSQLDMWSDQPLEAAPSMRVPVPRWVLPRSFHEAYPANGSTEVEMDYLFAGLEFRQTVNLIDDGVRAQYTVVEGGKTGGRYSELVFLHASSSSEKERSTDKMQEEDPEKAKLAGKESISVSESGSGSVSESRSATATPRDHHRSNARRAHLAQLYDAAYGFLDHLGRFVPGGLKPVERPQETDAAETDANDTDGSISINIDMDTNVTSSDDEEEPTSAVGQGS